MARIKLPVLPNAPSLSSAAEILAERNTRGLLVKGPGSYRLYAADHIFERLESGAKHSLKEVPHVEIALPDVIETEDHAGPWGSIPLKDLLSPNLYVGVPPPLYSCPEPGCTWVSRSKGKCPFHHKDLE
jgi:hypothetical protein